VLFSEGNSHLESAVLRIIGRAKQDPGRAKPVEDLDRKIHAEALLASRDKVRERELLSSPVPEGARGAELEDGLATARSAGVPPVPITLSWPGALNVCSASYIGSPNTGIPGQVA